MIEKLIQAFKVVSFIDSVEIIYDFSNILMSPISVNALLLVIIIYKLYQFKNDINHLNTAEIKILQSYYNTNMKSYTISQHIGISDNMEAESMVKKGILSRAGYNIVFKGVTYEVQFNLTPTTQSYLKRKYKLK